jgi:hypothetical protein
MLFILCVFYLKHKSGMKIWALSKLLPQMHYRKCLGHDDQICLVKI